MDSVAEAMRAKRRELIAHPLDRIWDELALVAIQHFVDNHAAIACTKYKNMIVIAHKDIPLHIWDGKKMIRLRND